MTRSTALARLGLTLSEAVTGLAAHARRWTLPLARFLVVQILVQLLGMLAGLLIVRTLTKQDYAYYTLATTLIPTLCLLANSGVTFAASALGGQVWTDRRKLGQVVVTAFKASRIMVAVSTGPVLLAFAWLLHRNGAGLVAASAVLGLSLLAAAFQFSSGILTVAPRLKGEFRFLQRTERTTAGFRLALVAGASLAWLNAELAIVITAVANAVQWFQIRTWVRREVDLDAPADPAMEAEMRRVAKRQWLNELYYVTQGQISIYLLSIFGSAASVADFGALGRIGFLFTAPGVAMQNVVLPRFARCQEPRRLRLLYIQIFLVNAAIAALPVLASLLFPQAFLWLLGAQYGGLRYELLLVALNVGTAAMGGIARLLNDVRAWIVPSWVLVPISVAAQLLLMAAIGVSTLPQVLWIAITTNLVLMCVYLGGAVHFGRRFERSAQPA